MRFPKKYKVGRCHISLFENRGEFFLYKLSKYIFVVEGKVTFLPSRLKVVPFSRSSIVPGTHFGVRCDLSYVRKVNVNAWRIAIWFFLNIEQLKLTDNLNTTFFIHLT